MKKKVLVFLTMATAMLFAMTGCSGNVPKDSEVTDVWKWNPGRK